MDIRSLILSDDELKCMAPEKQLPEKAEAAMPETAKAAAPKAMYSVIDETETSFAVLRETARSESILLVDVGKKDYRIFRKGSNESARITGHEYAKFFNNLAEPLELKKVSWISRLESGKHFGNYLQETLSSGYEELMREGLFGMSGSRSEDMTFVEIANNAKEAVQIVVNAITERFHVSNRDVLIGRNIFNRYYYASDIVDCSTGVQIPVSAVNLLRDIPSVVHVLFRYLGRACAERYAREFLDSQLRERANLSWKSNNYWKPEQMELLNPLARVMKRCLNREKDLGNVGDRVVDYLLYDLPRQGYASHLGRGIHLWDDVCAAQEELYGEIRDPFPEALESEAERLGKIQTLKYICECRSTLGTFFSHLGVRDRDGLDEAGQQKLLEARKQEWLPLVWKPEGDSLQVIAPESYTMMAEEMQEQQNRPSQRVQDLMDGKCSLFYLRSQDPDKAEKSIATIEVRNGVVVDAKGRNNVEPDPEYMNFIRRWAKVKGLLMVEMAA